LVESFRFFVRAPGGRAIFGFANIEGARTAALAYGEGAFVVDTLAQAYMPMLQETREGELVYAGYGGWDTGRFGLERDLVEGIKKGHVAIVHAFLAKGAPADACDRNGAPALLWAVGGGKREIVELLLAEGAEVNARDTEGRSALRVAEARGRKEIAALLRAKGGES
jgi:hypothetical protein